MNRRQPGKEGENRSLDRGMVCAGPREGEKSGDKETEAEVDGRGRDREEYHAVKEGNQQSMA